MEYPRRFYYTTSKGEKKLKIVERYVVACRYCGTYFADYLEVGLCSKFCKAMHLFWGR